MSVSEFDAVRLFHEDVKDEDFETVMNAVNRLGAVAAAVGPTRARTELLPLLMEVTEQDNDEAMTGMAKQLAEFVELIGGPTHAHLLLPLLEKLAGEEEAVVRDTAVESLNKIVGKIPKADIISKYVPMVKRLANGDWFTTRVSACGLFASVYAHVADNVQSELRSLFVTLCNDDTPMVRKAAFTQLGKFASHLQKQFYKPDVYPIIKTVAVDDIDYMRTYAIDSCAALAKVVDAKEFSEVLFPLIEGLQDDSSWRVRQQLANCMADLCANVNATANGAASSAVADTLSKKLIAIFAKLLKDKETEVRTAACKVMADVCGALKVGMLEHIAPVLETLAVDPVQNVRVAFANSLVGLCPVFGKEVSGKILVPIIQQLTKDEYFEVRNNIINKMDVLSEAIGSAGITTFILPTLLELAKDPKWRVRHGVIEKSALLGQILGQKTWEKRFQAVLVGALTDHVFAIRESACEQIGLIVKDYGGKWAAEKLFPQCFQIYDKNTNYLHRMTCLMIVNACATPCAGEVGEKALLPILIQACTDDVANVRVGAAKAAIELISKLEQKVAATKLVPLLQKMASDTDGDVSYFSQQALKKFS